MAFASTNGYGADAARHPGSRVRFASAHPLRKRGIDILSARSLLAQQEPDRLDWWALLVVLGSSLAGALLALMGALQ